MSSPTGVGRLMDAMLEREVIRNETLLLLISLTRGSEDLRKIVAFEGAFERCFNIIREEGAADGGIIVQDCLELCTNLLRGSPSNQSFFREADGLVAKLPEFLRADAVPAPPTASYKQPMPAQKAANLLCAVELVTMLVSDGETPGADANAPPPGRCFRRRRRARDGVARRRRESRLPRREPAALFRAGAMDALLELCLGANAAASASVRAHATRCLGECRRRAAVNQDALFAAETTRAPEAPADGGALVTTTPSDELPRSRRSLRRSAWRSGARTRGARGGGGASRAVPSRNPDLRLVLVSTVVAPAGSPGSRRRLARRPPRPGAHQRRRGGGRSGGVVPRGGGARHALEGNAAAKAKMQPSRWNSRPTTARRRRRSCRESCVTSPPRAAAETAARGATGPKRLSRSLPTAPRRRRSYRRRCSASS